MHSHVHQQLDLHETKKETFQSDIPLNQNHSLEPRINVLGPSTNAVILTHLRVSTLIPVPPAQEDRPGQMWSLSLGSRSHF